MKLRPYEERAVAELLRLFRRYRKIVGVAPTGSGKTVIGAALIREMLKARRVLWLAHRFELLSQARDQLIAAGLPESDVGILSGTETINPGARVLVAGVGMFRTRQIPRVDLVVVDEAHHVAAASYREVVDFLPKARILGLTATPWRLDGEPLGEVFDHLYVMAEAVELIADGYIRESVVYGVAQERAAEMVEGLRPAGADYSPRKLDALMRKQPLMADIVREWFRLAKGRPTIVYACTLDHARDLLGRFRRAGAAAEYLDWSTPAADRSDILERLASGETSIVVNVAILTEGIDCPPVKCIVAARPTKSLTLWRQMCGRGARPSGDDRPLVLDHAGNSWRLGLPDMHVPWSLTDRIKLGGAAPVKRCECGAMNPIAAKHCSECGAEFPLTERELKERAAELERIRLTEAERLSRLAILRQLAASKGLGEDWVQQVLRDAEAAA